MQRSTKAPSSSSTSASSRINTFKNNKRKINDTPSDSNNRFTGVGRAGKEDDGGFLREVQVPDRIIRTQQRQAVLQKEQIDRINRAAADAAAAADGIERGNDVPEDTYRSTTTVTHQTTKRRKGSRKSIWNMAMELSTTSPDNKTIRKNQPPPLPPSPSASSSQTMHNNSSNDHGDVICSSCKSDDVHSFGNITSRNADVRKGEIWGSGDRGESVINRYQCNNCGKTWNEEE
jgi:hypothetical protein